MPGSATVTGFAAASAAGSAAVGRPVSRTGAACPPTSVVLPLGARSYSLTKRTASPVGEVARSGTVAEPTRSTGAVSSADRYATACPGTSLATPTPLAAASTPAPGSVDTAAGVPSGGFATGCGAPV